MHAWKEIYQDVNKFYNDYSILNMILIKLFTKEIECIFLYVHSVLPLHYNEQGIYPEDTSISKYNILFNTKILYQWLVTNGLTAHRQIMISFIGIF